MKLEMLSLVLRLDCLSCVLTVFSTILVGRRCWEGWVLAAANSLIICVIGLRTAQLGFIPGKWGEQADGLQKWAGAEGEIWGM